MGGAVEDGYEIETALDGEAVEAEAQEVCARRLDQPFAVQFVAVNLVAAAVLKGSLGVGKSLAALAGLAERGPPQQQQ